MKKVYKYFVLLGLVVFSPWYIYRMLPLNMDGIWNYGFAYNISKGLIPYLDYNMIVPPLWPYLVSIPVYFIGNHLITYYVIISILIAGITYICYKKIGYKALFIYLLLLIYPHNGYNIFCLFLFMILLCYIDKENDILIAIIVSLMILTKQTMGILIIPSIIYSKKKKKTICVYLVFCLLLLLYLVINNNFFEFVNYCFLGMLDFTNNSNDSFLLFFIVEIIVVGYLFVAFLKSKKRSLLYIMLFQVIVVPIFEPSHFFWGFVPVIYYVLGNYKKLVRYFFGLMIGTFVITFYIQIIYSFYDDRGSIYLNDKSFINGKRLPKFTNYEFDLVHNYIDEYKDYRLYILASNAYLYKLEYGIPINKYDLINDGNMGYNGSKVYVEEIDNYCKKNKCLFMIDSSETVQDFNQVNREITGYIINNYLFIYSSSDVTFFVNMFH